MRLNKIIVNDQLKLVDILRIYITWVILQQFNRRDLKSLVTIRM